MPSASVKSGFGEDVLALVERRPQAAVAHDDRVDDAKGVKGELILAEDRKLARADDVALLRVEVAGKDLHERGFAGAVGSGETVAAAGGEGGRDFLEQNFSAVAHGDIANGDHAALNRNGVLRILVDAGTGRPGIRGSRRAGSAPAAWQGRGASHRNRVRRPADSSKIFRWLRISDW